MLILDSGAFIAVERRDRDVLALLKGERLLGRTPLTNGGVVAQVWRGSNGRQALVAQTLSGTRVEPIDEQLGRHAGMLLRASTRRDAIDASVICLAREGDDVLTSDPHDLAPPAAALGVRINLIAV
jgi:hypothetical protein